MSSIHDVHNAIVEALRALKSVPQTRETALVKTKLEEASMWWVKAYDSLPAGDKF